MSSVIEANQRFPDRKQERQLSAFQAIPQYDYNYRAEVLPKAELKGAPRYNKFHLDMSGKSGAANLHTATNNFLGMSVADASMVGAKLSHSTRAQMPVHPDLAQHTNAWNSGGRDWNVSNQVIPAERRAAFDALAAKSLQKAERSKMRATRNGAYKSPMEREALRNEEIRQLKQDKVFTDEDGKPFRHSYRMSSTLSATAGWQTAAKIESLGKTADSLDEWDGEITFAKKRPGEKTRTRWNYAAPT